MDKPETIAALKLFLAVARADGKVDVDERRLLTALGRAHGISLGPSDPVDIDGELAKLKSAESKAFTFRVAVALANVDGKCTSPEHALLDKIRLALAPSSPLPLEVVEKLEGAVMKRARAEIDKATDAFLEDIAKRGETLGRAEYEKLLAELDAKKTAALEKAANEVPRE